MRPLRAESARRGLVERVGIERRRGWGVAAESEFSGWILCETDLNYKVVLVSLSLHDFRGKGHAVKKHSYGEGIRDEYIVCLECDKTLQLLSHRHLALHGLTPSTYRQKWGIASHIPLTSHHLAQRRCRLVSRLEKYERTWSGSNAHPQDLNAAAEAEMGDFFHELAEALTVIQGQVHLAQKSLSSYMRPQEYLEAIQHTVTRIGQRMQGDSPMS